MSNKMKFAPIYFLQFIPIILYPPTTLQGGWVVILIVIAAILALGYFLLTGRSWALKMSIFVQGLNIIVRIMMGFANALSPENLGGGFDGTLIITSLLGIIISAWFLFRLDQPDIKATIVA
jgi:hypothetical protein